MHSELNQLYMNGLKIVDYLYRITHIIICMLEVLTVN